MGASRFYRPRPVRFRRPPTGAWYFVLTVLSAGLFAWVPFLHAGSRLRRPDITRRAVVFGGVALLMLPVAGLTPVDAAGRPAGLLGQILQALTGFISLGVIIVACVQLVPLRRAVYEFGAPGFGAPGFGAPGPLPFGAPGPQPVVTGFIDPAIVGVMAARSRRAEARAIVARDPLMARELRIGRPDEPRRYDDGGLVDLHHAPAPVIAGVCGIPLPVAELLVAARDARGVGFSDTTEALIVAEVPIQFWDQIRERAVLLP